VSRHAILLNKKEKNKPMLYTTNIQIVNYAPSALAVSDSDTSLVL
jgi:hypothetical protein